LFDWVKLKKGTHVRRYCSALKFSQQGVDAKRRMHAFFFYADCYHEVDEAGTINFCPPHHSTNFNPFFIGLSSSRLGVLEPHCASANMN
jgi:hypothetical protein